MKNLLKITIIITLLLFFGGCGKPQLTTIYDPDLNKQATAEIGKNIYEKTYAKIVTQKYVNIEGKDYKFAKVDDAECAIHNNSESLLDYNCDGYFTHKRGSITERGKDKNQLDKPIKYEVITKNIYYPLQNSFKYEAIYQGRIGSKIKIMYREYYYDFNIKSFMIRPAFEQIIDYELNEDSATLVGFKGLRIEVIKATNMSITYKIIKDYD